MAALSAPTTARKGTTSVIMLTPWWFWKWRNAIIFDGALPDLAGPKLTLGEPLEDPKATPSSMEKCTTEAQPQCSNAALTQKRGERSFGKSTKENVVIMVLPGP